MLIQSRISATTTRSFSCRRRPGNHGVAPCGPDDFGEHELALIERCFADNSPAIRAVVREDVEETLGSFPDGPFPSHFGGRQRPLFSNAGASKA